MPLTEAAITELNAASQPASVVHEWLRSWFDGAPHDVGIHTGLTFPECAVAWGRNAPGTVDDGVREIRYFMEPITSKDCQEPTGWVRSGRTSLRFFIRVDMAGGARASALDIADRLAFIIRHPEARAGLSERGISNLTCVDPVLLAEDRFEVVMIPAKCHIRYPVSGRE